MIGTVRHFNSTRGFGYISPDCGGEDIFVHVSALECAGLSGIARGERFSYEVAVDRGGRAAAKNLRAA